MGWQVEPARILKCGILNSGGSYVMTFPFKRPPNDRLVEGVRVMAHALH
nr:MAG TPA: hypothetical protein [Caudoviricetes sp.]